MKRCPQCEFIYEDDQSLCDMDGKTLVYETTQSDLAQGTAANPSVPRKKSRPRTLMAVLAGVILATVLFLVFYASPRLLAKPENRTLNPATQNLPEKQKLQSSPQPASAPPNSNPATAPANTQSPDSAATSRGLNPAEEFGVISPRTTGSKTNHTSPKTTDSRLTISRRLPPLPRVPSLPRLPAAKVTEKSPSIAAPRKPVAHPKSVGVIETPRSSSTPRPVAANQKKESRVGSFLKKTGRILSKPFKL